MKRLASITAFSIISLIIAHGASADTTYTVRKGDSLYKIAKAFRVNMDSLREANNLGSDRLKPGERITVPSREAAPRKERTAARPAGPVPKNETAAAPQDNGPYHTIRKGENLGSIAKKYGISVAELTELNNITKTRKLRTGQQILVQRTGPKTYTVRKGDTIWKIAKRLRLDADELMELNDLESDDLKPGQKLVLEEWSGETGTQQAAMISKVKIGETIEALSKSPEIESMNVNDRVVLLAKKMLNIPYRFGGSSFLGIDCSGYVQKVFGFMDITLPRTAREQFHIGEPVTKDDLLIGDLVFFRTYASFPSHVGIYLGNNLFIHASSKGRKVTIDSLDTPYYIKRYIGAKRLLTDELPGDGGKDQEG